MRSLGEFITGELAGDESVPTPGQEGTRKAGPHEELGNAEGAESGEEFFEATAEQLAAAEGGDLKGIEGFEGSEAGEEGEEGEELNLGGIISPISSLFESGEGAEGY